MAFAGASRTCRDWRNEGPERLSRYVRCCPYHRGIASHDVALGKPGESTVRQAARHHKVHNVRSFLYSRARRLRLEEAHSPIRPSTWPTAPSFSSSLILNF